MRYPDGRNGETRNVTNYGNRGMSLEKDINLSNEYYRNIDRAIIYKKPTPIQVTKVAYAKKGKLIKEAYFKVPSTTDYNGLYRGKYIDFEAKETRKKRLFPLANIHGHQIEHIRNIINHGGISFLIVKFSSLNKTYLIKGEDIIAFINDNKNSIPISFFSNHAYVITEKYNPRLEYLDIIDQVFFGGDISEEFKKETKKVA